MIINMNDPVKVELTEEGRKILVRHYAKYDQRPPDNEWNDGEFRMWSLLQIFGPHTYMGMKLHFVLNQIAVGGPDGPATNSQ